MFARVFLEINGNIIKCRKLVRGVTRSFRSDKRTGSNLPFIHFVNHRSFQKVVQLHPFYQVILLLQSLVRNVQP